MITTLSTNQAINDLLADWTYAEAEALVNFYEELEEDSGEAIEFDRVAIRCDWTSATEEEAREMYDIEGDISEYLNDHGYCIEVEDCLLFLNF